jgi:hypothetical protein
MIARHLPHGHAIAASMLSAWLCLPVSAEVLPADSGALNVRDFGAKGDGRNDDTAAIRAAVLAAQVDQGKVFWPAKMVYFPAGTYRVTDTIAKRSADGCYLSSMYLMGEARDSVRIKLDDAAAGYGQAQQPKAVIFTSSSLLAGSAAAGGKDYLGKGEGNEAYGNYVEDMTVDVGRGNSGAVAIDYIASNVGAIRHVRLIAGEGSGRTGVSMERKNPGPLLISDLSIEGFARGLAVRHPEYSVTMENLRLSGQSEVAIRNEGNSLALRGIVIETAAVGIQNLGPEGLIVADRVSVRLTAPAATWIDNRGYLTFKDVTVSALAGSFAAAQGLASAQGGAYFGLLRLTDFDAHWTLTALPAPDAWNPPPSGWANVVRFGARPNSGEDATESIRAAMKSGAEAVYFPSGRYVISDSIDVPSQVRRIGGMLSAISIEKRAPSFTREMGMFRIATGGAPLTIDRLTFDNGGKGAQLGMEHSGSREIVLRDYVSHGVAAVQRKESGGRLYLENTCCGPLRVAGRAGVWSRQLNTEGSNVRIVNDGAPLSILGLKAEQNATIVDNHAGAETEVVGGLLYIVFAPRPHRPAFINRDGSRLNAAYAESAYLPESFYLEHIVDIDANGTRRTLTADRLPARGLARMAPGIGAPLAPAEDDPKRP